MKELILLMLVIAAATAFGAMSTFTIIKLTNKPLTCPSSSIILHGLAHV